MWDSEHLTAAVWGDISTLEKLDEGLKEVLAEDRGVLDDAPGEARGAMRLYRSSLAAFDPGPDIRRAAFQAATRDDVEALEALLDKCGSSLQDARNAAGQTLLEVARERGSPGAVLLLDPPAAPAPAEEEQQQGGQAAVPA